MLSGRAGGGDFDGDAPLSRASRPGAAARGGAAPAGGEFEDFPAALQDEDDDLPF
jgi:single-strand DNA-binding protein